MQQPVLRAHPERTAWVVVWCSFAVFCVLVVAVPLGIRYVLRHATVARPATLEVLEGTARVTNPAAGRLDAVIKGKPMAIGEGIVIQLDEKTSADLRFFDGSYVHILPDSDLTVERVRAPRFSTGVTPNTISLRMSKGKLRLVTSKVVKPSGLSFTLYLQELGTTVVLKEDGLYGADVGPEGGEVWANLGSAVVTGASRTVRLLALERTSLAPGEPPTPPVASAKNLLVNGDFKHGLDGWEYYNDQGADGGNTDGTVALVGEGGSQVVRFSRTGSNGNHCETVLEQKIDKALPDPIASLVIRANLKVISQSLPGGGILASEYPLTIRIRYRDQFGSENEWTQGFYTGDPQGYPTGTGISVPRGSEYYFETGNLLNVLQPRPARIVWIKVYASGWDYESELSSISLEVQ